MDEKTQIHKISELLHDGTLDDESIIKGSGPRLVILAGPKSGAKFALSEEKITLGRHSSSQIFLDDVTVSRQHAEIHLEKSEASQKSEGGGTYLIKDSQSLNGTYVNKERIDSQSLKWGDEVQIGKFKFLFLDDDNP